MRALEKLKEISVRKAQPTGEAYKLMDGGGLYLLVTATGSKLWRFNYRHQGKHKTLALGQYPDVGLADAREKHRAARKLLAAESDPGEARKAKAKALEAKHANILRAIAEEWLKGPHASKVTPGTVDSTRKLLWTNVMDGEIGSRPIADITAPELLAVVRKVEARGATYSAHKALQLCSQVWRYAIATGRAERDVTADLRGALNAYKVRHHPAITDPVRVGDLLRAIDGYSGSPLTVAAMKLAILTFVRPGELRHAKWSDIDLERAEWRYFVGKTRNTGVAELIVPLPRQAVAILESLRPLSGHLGYVFPGVRAKDKPMSENTVNAALRYLGFDGEEAVGHGFRATARTILDEVMGYPVHIIEQQLAHAVKDPNGRAYNRTAHLPQRREMMQKWADYLDELKAGAKVLNIKREAA
ncbi:MAG: integrase arm-type DNA-binding domain-containing protein [Hydrogenophilales bacterium]|nr:integrase arm-type DNA-binding domain-containing protein [Hydrogenophilales bacterium]